MDFSLLLGETDATQWESLLLPRTDFFGVLLRKDAPLTQKDILLPQDLAGKPLIAPRQALHESNLVFNGSIMVVEGLATPFSAITSSIPLGMARLVFGRSLLRFR